MRESGGIGETLEDCIDITAVAHINEATELRFRPALGKTLESSIQRIIVSGEAKTQ
jgi:hypothetical protein